MMQELRDAKRALGFGVTFLAYAAWLAYVAWRKASASSRDTRAKLIHDGAEKRRPILLREEGLTE